MINNISKIIILLLIIFLIILISNNNERFNSVKEEAREVIDGVLGSSSINATKNDSINATKNDTKNASTNPSTNVSTNPSTNDTTNVSTNAPTNDSTNPSTNVSTNETTNSTLNVTTNPPDYPTLDEDLKTDYRITSETNNPQHVRIYNLLVTTEPNSTYQSMIAYNETDDETYREPLIDFRNTTANIPNALMGNFTIEGNNFTDDDMDQIYKICKNIAYIAGDLTIKNTNLKHLDFFKSNPENPENPVGLKEIKGSITITGNNELESLCGLMDLIIPKVESSLVTTTTPSNIIIIKDNFNINYIPKNIPITNPIQNSNNTTTSFENNKCLNIIKDKFQKNSSYSNPMTTIITSTSNYPMFTASESLSTSNVPETTFAPTTLGTSNVPSTTVASNTNSPETSVPASTPSPTTLSTSNDPETTVASTTLSTSNVPSTTVASTTLSTSNVPSTTVATTTLSTTTTTNAPSMAPLDKCGESYTLANAKNWPQKTCPEETPKCYGHVFEKNWGVCVHSNFNKEGNDKCGEQYNPATLAGVDGWKTCPKTAPKCVGHVPGKWGHCTHSNYDTTKDCQTNYNINEGPYTCPISRPNCIAGVCSKYPTTTHPTTTPKVTLTNEELRKRVSEWITNAEVAEETYGHINAWDVSGVTDMSELFKGVVEFNQDISGWNVKNVTNMNGMFWGATEFNQNISEWDVGGVTDMRYLFNGAVTFNQNISGWDVKNVTNMIGMFWGATAFNQNISGWDVSNVTNMAIMFSDATSFDQDISMWGEKVSNVTNMTGMFWGATEFNQNISGWNVSNVTNMYGMFWGATAFNQDISGWNVEGVQNYTDFAKGSGLTEDKIPTAFKNTISLKKGEAGTNSACKSDVCIFDTKYCTKLYGQCGILETEFADTCNKWDKCAGGVCRGDYKFEDKQYCLARGQMDEKSSDDMWGFKKVVKSGIF